MKNTNDFWPLINNNFAENIMDPFMYVDHTIQLDLT